MQTINHKFVEDIPAEKEPGILYISLEFAVATHLCPCGCGSVVVTRLARNGWSVTFDGETVSLDPSIGNWSQPCKSHYWIRNNRIHWARRFNDREIMLVRWKDERDHQAAGKKSKNVRKKTGPRKKNKGKH